MRYSRVVVALLLLVCAALTWFLVRTKKPPAADATPSAASAGDDNAAELATLQREMAPQIERFCAYCHPTPSPAEAPRDRHEVGIATLW